MYVEGIGLKHMNGTMQTRNNIPKIARFIFRPRQVASYSVRCLTVATDCKYVRLPIANGIGNVENKRRVSANMIPEVYAIQIDIGSNSRAVELQIDPLARIRLGNREMLSIPGMTVIILKLERLKRMGNLYRTPGAVIIVNGLASRQIVTGHEFPVSVQHRFLSARNRDNVFGSAAVK